MFVLLKLQVFIINTLLIIICLYSIGQEETPGPRRFHSKLNFVLKLFCEGIGPQDEFQGQRSEFRKLIGNGTLSHNEISDEKPLGT